MAQLTAAGVEAWRVDLLPLTAGTGDHLSVYGMMDISLDTFPYAGESEDHLGTFLYCLELSGGWISLNAAVLLSWVFFVSSTGHPS